MLAMNPANASKGPSL
jgi:hypothetical protein